MDEKETSYPDVFLINITKDIIMFMYDDRGSEVITKNKETIRSLSLLISSKTPPQNSAKTKKLGGDRAAHKSPIVRAD